mmetsp:Transcript_62327/g.177018  ORF Transcript_62327/g.177018 Transcript_62327/m.177018 type:complete len:345 (-) Transcript_62327:79-1113(-)|eukprot:CAMPEP_0168372338 /NCGR_PEP_ID=MMETSP0228-20121227/8231_1 /TAXON_ID=133427 /ORGANISM="Protoceratium reticulatum, Strain CCCM 535 (=CCMP 1889)" /LENGTH=344 /DNA_ID=CAMNT_0008385245 /DNA_START=79 /DNA_END=1113 /DNA_ORIENTATION=+
MPAQSLLVAALLGAGLGPRAAALESVLVSAHRRQDSGSASRNKAGDDLAEDVNLIGSHMEVAIPKLGSHTRHWVKCTVIGKGALPDSYSVSVDNYPELDRALDAVPARALRRRSGINLLSLRGEQENTAAFLAGYVGTMETQLFDCARFPRLCQKPFSCESFRMKEALAWYYWGVNRTGQGNLRAFCAVPNATLGMNTECLAQSQPASVSFENIMTLRSGVERELQASRCFAEGFCTDTAFNAFNKDTKGLIAANYVCDMKYGRPRWTSFGTMFASVADTAETQPDEAWLGFKGRKQTMATTIAACATGRFACDVAACKEGFCQIEYFQKKYGHLAPQLQILGR